MDNIQTERLVLRPWRADDLDSLHELLSDPFTAEMAGYSASVSREESLLRLAGMIGSVRAWAVTLKGDDVPVGWIRFRKDDMRRQPGCLMLGFAVRTDLRRKGLMSEALGKALEDIFMERHVTMISAKCLPDNTASRKVLTENGFTRDGILDGLVLRDGEGERVCIYSLRDHIDGRDDGLAMLPARVKSLYDPADGWLSGLCNAVSEIYTSMDMVNWAGVYLLENGSLRLGPFMGKPACTVLTLDKGVCAKSAREMRTVVVPDVHAFEGHIACDSDSRSEIVVPLISDDGLLGVLDIDSPVPDRFSERDRDILEKTAVTLRDILVQRKEEIKA